MFFGDKEEMLNAVVKADEKNNQEAIRAYILAEAGYHPLEIANALNIPVHFVKPYKDKGVWLMNNQ